MDFTEEINTQITKGDRLAVGAEGTDKKLEALAHYFIALRLYDLSTSKPERLLADVNSKIRKVSDVIAASTVKKDDESSDKINVIPSSKLQEYSFDKLAGLVKEKMEMVNVFINPNIFPGLYKKPKGGILLYGPPGTGKTEIAKAASNSINAYGIEVYMFNADSASMKSKWQGGTEKQIKSYFTRAEQIARDDMEDCRRKGNSFCKTLSILFMDEFEAIAGNRDSDDQSMTHSVNALISSMQGIETYDNVIVLAATNKPWELDPAVTRRFSSRVFVDIPHDKAREDLIRNALLKHYEPKEKFFQFTSQETLDTIVERVVRMTGVRSDRVVNTTDRSTPEEIVNILKGLKLPSGWLAGRRASSTAQHPFGFSASDLDQIVSRAINIAASRATRFKYEGTGFFAVNQNTKITWDGSSQPSQGAIVGIEQLTSNSKYFQYLRDLKNYNITAEDFDLAIQQYGSTVVERDYVNYLYYEKTRVPLFDK